MSEPIRITDIGDPRIAAYARLTEAQLRSRRDGSRAVFLAESLPVIGYALDAGCRPLSFLMDRRHLEGPGRPMLERCPEVPVFTAEDETLEQLTGYKLTRSVLCAMARPPERCVEEVCRGARRLAVLEGITDAANVGAIFRSAAALGMDGVLLSPTCADPLNRRACRVSMGGVFQIPWARFDRWPEEGMAYLRGEGITTLAMALRTDSLSLEDPGLTRLPRLALLLGTEGSGLRDETIALAHHTVRIPMAHGVDSLNVAAAAAVAFWQLKPR